jgi:hypothetical protein
LKIPAGNYQETAMNLKVETSNFLNDLERVAAVRREIADSLSNIATAINQSELAAAAASGNSV